MKKNLLVHGYMLHKVLDKIKETIVIVKFNDTRTSIDRDEKFPDYMTFKNVVILITSIIKGNGKFHPKILEEALYNE